MLCSWYPSPGTSLRYLGVIWARSWAFMDHQLNSRHGCNTSTNGSHAIIILSENSLLSHLHYQTCVRDWNSMPLLSVERLILPSLLLQKGNYSGITVDHQLNSRHGCNTSTNGSHAIIILSENSLLSEQRQAAWPQLRAQVLVLSPRCFSSDSATQSLT
jgi:hypothetical protein